MSMGGRRHTCRLGGMPPISLLAVTLKAETMLLERSLLPKACRLPARMACRRAPGCQFDGSNLGHMKPLSGQPPFLLSPCMDYPPQQLHPHIHALPQSITG